MNEIFDDILAAAQEERAGQTEQTRLEPYDKAAYREKKQSDGAPINAGYMVFQPEIFDYLEGDSTVLEREPLEKLAQEGQLMSYMHRGFWQCMDNVREKEMLEKLLANGKAPWKKWED